MLADRYITCLVLVVCAGSTQAQVGLSGTSQYPSGIRCDPVGGATLDPPLGRRLPVRNIGSSGEDGVEIIWNSVYGGSSAIDLASIRESPTLGTIRHRYKGWDGTIKGRIDCSGRNAGPLLVSCDWSASGATAIQWRCVGDHGVVLASGVTQGSSFSWGVTQQGLPAGSSGRMAINRKGPPGQHRIAFPDGSNSVVSLNGLPPGQPVVEMVAIEFTVIGGTDDGRASSVDVTASGRSAFDLVECALAPTGPCKPPYLCDEMWDAGSIYGLGQSHLEETCSPGGDCDDTDPRDRYVSCDNLGHSGQDGVCFDFGPGAGDGSGLQLARKHTKTGHVTLLKAYDDGGNELYRTTVSDGGSAGAETITLDGTASSAAGVLVTAYDGDGNPTGSSLVLGAVATIAVPIMCPNGGIWCAFGSPPRWGCYFPTQFVLPGGPVLNGTSVSLTPVSSVGAPPPRTRRIEVTGNPQTGGFAIDDLRPPTCAADLDDGSGSGTPDTGVDINDLLYFLSHFEGGC